MKISEIFTPNDTPTVTYVGREDLRLEENLKSYLELPKMVVSISGPSKTGKTVLVKRVADTENIIPVIGAGIKSATDLWVKILRWMSVPEATTNLEQTSHTVGASIHLKGGLNVLVAKGEAGGTGDYKFSTGSSASSMVNVDPLAQVIKEISNSDFIVFIDDFHYIPSELREEVGRQIKIASDAGVKILAASVPHRSDDVVRSNPELRGRVAALDVGRWEGRHLEMIANRGFDVLNLEIAPDVARRLSQEALGSPQLMQTICYCLCKVINVSEKQPQKTRRDISEQEVSQALEDTARFTDFSKLLTLLHSGPRTRGTERKLHKFTDGSEGDVYRAVLLALRKESIKLSFSYDDLLLRVRDICTESNPVGSSINSCLEQMQIISNDIQPSSPVLEWTNDILDVIDPYFAFFLRCSDKLQELGKE
jgi:hypothetical protein